GSEVKLRHAYVIKLEEVVKDPTSGEVTKLRLTFKDGKATADRGDGKPDAIDYKIDPSTTPKSLDLIEKNNPMLAIYELDGDTLKICVSEGGQQGVRPAEMKSDGKNVAVITLKRVKEDEKKDK
ncbi:MAG: TIGR03067 domain-containing protein, partial [Gemmataceae bacterium]